MMQYILHYVLGTYCIITTYICQACVRVVLCFAPCYPVIPCVLSIFGYVPVPVLIVSLFVH